MYHDSSGLFEVMLVGERKGAQADTDGYRKSNAFGVAAGELGKQSAKESTFPNLSISNISLSFFHGEIYFENSSSMGKHAPSREPEELLAIDGERQDVDRWQPTAILKVCRGPSRISLN